MDKSNALARIRAAGVVGAGGAGFPSYKKLDAPVDHVIANGAECEPLLYKDREVMLRNQEPLVRGLALMRDLTGAKTATIAVKRKNADLVDILRPAAAGAGIEFFVMEDVYPAGDEYVLVHDVTGRRIPPGGIPPQVGVVVSNVETIVNVAHAVDGQPVLDKYLTIAGAVHHPVTVSVPVGTSFRECIDLAGGLTTDDAVVLTGGVMMGGLETDLSLPVTKTTGGLIALPSSHPLAMRKGESSWQYTRVGHGACDQCSLCTELCPRYLLGYPIQPHLVMRSLLMNDQRQDHWSLWAAYCCECNICSLYACPEKLDPGRICADAKRRLKESRISRSADEIDRLFQGVHQARNGRQVPISLLYQRLGLKTYDTAAHFEETDVQPRSVIVPLNSHVGVPAKPAVGVGARVTRGEIVGTVPDAALGCPAHASVAGMVTAVDTLGVHIAAE